MSRVARSHLNGHVGPVRFHKELKYKMYLSPIMYGWYHNTPWAKYNNFAWFWSEHKDIRKTVVNHVQRVTSARAFGTRLDMCPSVIQELSQEGPFTLFCPRNQAMELIRPEAWEKLWDEERNKFFRHHVVRGKWGIKDLAEAEKSRAKVESLAEQPLKITATGSLETHDRQVFVDGARITKTNIRCWNGYVHFLDRPLIPRWRN
mmetsp:Transcript_95844/g.228292  ORF Transcript_95844/g.228292 Transcript_95844/m.228292 type:complete len:204 (-) Transcript_95844:68-679(-)